MSCWQRSDASLKESACSSSIFFDGVISLIEEVLVDCGMKGNNGGVVKGLNVLGVYAVHTNQKIEVFLKTKLKKGKLTMPKTG